MKMWKECIFLGGQGCYYNDNGDAVYIIAVKDNSQNAHMFLVIDKNNKRYNIIRECRFTTDLINKPVYVLFDRCKSVVHKKYLNLFELDQVTSIKPKGEIEPLW